MKTIFGILAVTVVLLVSCSESETFLPKESNNDGNGDPRLDRPQTIFEGEWLWIKTEGEGIAGPFSEDSTTAGYSLRYDFAWNTATSYKTIFLAGSPLPLIVKTNYNYSFEVSDDSAKQVLILTDSVGNAEKFLWEITTHESDSIAVVAMTLTNPEVCCKNASTQYFIRTKEADLHGSK